MFGCFSCVVSLRGLRISKLGAAASGAMGLGLLWWFLTS